MQLTREEIEAKLLMAIDDATMQGFTVSFETAFELGGLKVTLSKMVEAEERSWRTNSVISRCNLVMAEYPEELIVQSIYQQIEAFKGSPEPLISKPQKKEVKKNGAFEQLSKFRSK